MMRFAGLDGYRKGWVVVWIEGANRNWTTVPTISSLLAQPFSRAAIDIPIGVPEDKEDRGCDIEARRLLAPHHSRVFTGVRRWLFDMPNYDAIKPEALNRREKAVSKQMYAILPKIREVDSAITPALQDRLIETHPELVFWRLNGNEPLAKKKSAEGKARRRALLEADGFHGLDSWIAELYGTGAKIDDLFDACACAIAARDSTDRVPANPLADRRGLRMEINY